jgi:hypothetical protein
MNFQNITQWADEVEALAALVDELATRLTDLASLPKTDDPQALLEALLRVRTALKLPSPNTSLFPINDRAVQVHEHLRPALVTLFESVERGICQCVQHGAKHPSIVPTSDFWNALHRLDLDHLVGRQVLLAELRVLPANHRLRQLLPEGGYVPDGSGVETVVLGPIKSSYPADPVQLRPGQWFYVDEVVNVTKSWRAARQAMEDRHREQQETEQARRRDEELAWKNGDRGLAYQKLGRPA